MNVPFLPIPLTCSRCVIPQSARNPYGVCLDHGHFGAFFCWRCTGAYRGSYISSGQYRFRKATLRKLLGSQLFSIAARTNQHSVSVVNHKFWPGESASGYSRIRSCFKAKRNRVRHNNHGVSHFILLLWCSHLLAEIAC